MIPKSELVEKKSLFFIAKHSKQSSIIPFYKSVSTSVSKSSVRVSSNSIVLFLNFALKTGNGKFYTIGICYEDDGLVDMIKYTIFTLNIWTYAWAKCKPRSDCCSFKSKQCKLRPVSSWKHCKWANSVNPDQTAPKEQSDKSVHYLKFYCWILHKLLGCKMSFSNNRISMVRCTNMKGKYGIEDLT